MNLKITVFIAIIVFIACTARKPVVSKYSNSFENYIKNYKPLYHYKGDTFVIPRFNLVDDSINKILFKCAANKDFTLIKYAAAVISIQHCVLTKYSDEFIISDGLMVENNGFIELVRVFLNVENNGAKYNSINYFPNFLGETVFQIRNNLDKSDLNYLNEIIEKSDLCE